MKRLALCLLVCIFLMPVVFALEEASVQSFGFDPEYKFVDPQGTTLLSDLNTRFRLASPYAERWFLGARESFCNDIRGEQNCLSLTADYQLPDIAPQYYNPFAQIQPFRCVDIDGKSDREELPERNINECFFVPAELGNAVEGCDDSNYQRLQETCPPIANCGVVGIPNTEIRATSCRLTDHQGRPISHCQYDTDICYEAIEAYARPQCTPQTVEEDCVTEGGEPMFSCPVPGQSAAYCRPIDPSLSLPIMDDQGRATGERYTGVCDFDYRMCGAPQEETPSQGGQPSTQTLELGQACQGIGSFNIMDYASSNSRSGNIGFGDGDGSNSVSYKTNIAGVFVDPDTKDFWQDDCPMGEGPIQGVTSQIREWVHIGEFYNIFSEWETQDTDYMNALIEIDNYPGDPENSCFQNFIDEVEMRCAGTCETLGDLPDQGKDYDPGCSAYCLTNSQEGFDIDAKDMKIGDFRLGFTFDCPVSPSDGSRSFCVGTMLNTGQNGVEVTTNPSTVYAPAGYTQHYNIGQGDQSGQVQEGVAIFAAACISQVSQHGIDIGPSTQSGPPDPLFCCTSSSVECRSKNRCPEGYIYNPENQECEQILPTGGAISGRDTQSCKIQGLGDFVNNEEFLDIAAEELQNEFRSLTRNDLTQVFRNNLKVYPDNSFELVKIEQVDRTTDADATDRVYDALERAMDKLDPDMTPLITHCIASSIVGSMKDCAIFSTVKLRVPEVGRFLGEIPGVSTVPGIYTGAVPEMDEVPLEISVSCDDSYHELTIEGKPDTNYNKLNKQNGKRSPAESVRTDSRGRANLVITGLSEGDLVIVNGDGQTEFVAVSSCIDEKDYSGTGGGFDDDLTGLTPDDLTGIEEGVVCTDPDSCEASCEQGDCSIQAQCIGDDCDLTCSDCEFISCQGDDCNGCVGDTCSTTGNEHQIVAGCAGDSCVIESNKPLVITSNRDRSSPGKATCEGPFCHTLNRDLGTGDLIACSDLTGSCATIESENLGDIIGEVTRDLPFTPAEINPDQISIARLPNNDVQITGTRFVPESPVAITVGSETRIETTSPSGEFSVSVGNPPAGAPVEIVGMPLSQASSESFADAGFGSS